MGEGAQRISRAHEKKGSRTKLTRTSEAELVEADRALQRVASIRLRSAAVAACRLLLPPTRMRGAPKRPSPPHASRVARSKLGG